MRTAGYLVEYGPRIGFGRYKHVFCGPPPTAGALCPNCDRPLLHFLTLDTSDRRLGFRSWPSPRVPLLYCWTCNLAQGDFFYRVSATRVTIIRHKRGGAQDDFPYEDYPVTFPSSAARLVGVSAVRATAVAAANRGDDTHRPSPREREYDRPRHQIGGEPRLVQGYPARPLKCARCRRAMVLFATIADDCLDPRGFAGNGWVQVLYHRCARCRIVGAFHQCD